MNGQTSVASGFRGDINGLRAWAVVAVILYHFGVPGFGGGFVGVDVFFAISGFLMTAIVLGGLERGRFSLGGFYLARARRIVPALLALCAALLVLGWWGLLRLEYKALGADAAMALAFLSNLKFWREAGYFDAASHEKWLLHTWSLSVEWQFYLLLPLLLLVVWRWRPTRPAATAALVAAFAASLALCLVATPLYPTSAFFLLPTRAWEMLAGGLAYLLAARRGAAGGAGAALLEMGGLAAIAVAIATFDTASAWPGWRALVPVAGAVAVLLAARTQSPFTDNRAAQWLGTRSYSLYLWHWPVAVALGYLERQEQPLALAVGLMATLVLGQLSYRLIETPAREGLSGLRPAGNVAVLLGACLAIGLAGAGVWAQEGVGSRIPARINQVADTALDKNPRQAACHPFAGHVSPSCRFGGPHLRAVVLGDSHANAVVSSVSAALPPGDGVVEWSYSGCPTFFGALPTPSSRRGAGYQCAEFLEWVRARLDSVPADVPLIIVNRTSFYAMGKGPVSRQHPAAPEVYFSQVYTTPTPRFLAEFAEHLQATTCELARSHRVFVVRPIPEMEVDVPKSVSRALLRGGHRDVSISLAEYHQRNRVALAAEDLTAKRCGITILDPVPYLCPDGRCHGERGGHPLYYDDNHLNEYGNRLLTPMFARALGPSGAPAQAQGGLH